MQKNNWEVYLFFLRHCLWPQQSPPVQRGYACHSVIFALRLDEGDDRTDPDGLCDCPSGFLHDSAAVFYPIGAHESGLLGDDPNGIPNNLMPYIGRVAAGQLEKLTIFGGDYPTPDGTCQRDYLHVVDLAVGHLKALEYAASHTGVEAINLGTGHGISVLELVHAFETANQIKLPYEIGLAAF